MRTTIHLDGDVASGAGAAYHASFKTNLCHVNQNYRIFPGPQEVETAVDGQCGYRTEPCEFPESEVESKYPGYSCGSYVGTFALRDSPALSVAVDGRSVTFTFDPNKFPAGALPGGLAQDLARRETDPAVGGSGSAAEGTQRYGTLATAWAGTSDLQGVRHVAWTSGGADGTPHTAPVPLD